MIIRNSFVAGLSGLALLLGAGLGEARDQGFTSLDVNGEQVVIYRDEFSVPHIFAVLPRAPGAGKGGHRPVCEPLPVGGGRQPDGASRADSARRQRR